MRTTTTVLAVLAVAIGQLAGGVDHCGVRNAGCDASSGCHEAGGKAPAPGHHGCPSTHDGGCCRPCLAVIESPEPALVVVPPRVAVPLDGMKRPVDLPADLLRPPRLRRDTRS